MAAATPVLAGTSAGSAAEPGGLPGEGGTWTGSSPLPAASGVVAASGTLDTGFGFSYFPNQHIGATSWFVMAALGVDPYLI